MWTAPMIFVAIVFLSPFAEFSYSMIEILFRSYVKLKKQLRSKFPLADVAAK
jgi:hypothetical protein